MKKNEPRGGKLDHSLKKILLIMRIAVVLLFFSLLQTQANNAWSQKTKLSINFSDTELVDVLDQIENESDFLLLYNDQLIDANRKVSINVRDQGIEEVLKLLLEGTDVEYSILDRKIILAPSESMRAMQQPKSISGKVTEASGEPLPGVTVLVKGTTQGTVTNTDGEYTLTNVASDATLVFSFVGMRSQEITVGSQSMVNVTLAEETVGIEEVVAVGYGTQKKSHLTAAVEQVSGELLVNRPVSNISDAIQSTVAGLYIEPTNGGPASAPNINIRGFTGFNQKGGPLVLVDGVERRIIDVNPNDVESISVLKDAAASAIYGSRAPSGVILIITKSGQKDDQIRVNYSGNYNIGEPIGMPHWANSYEYAEKINEQYRNSLQSPIYKEETIQLMRDYASGKIDYNNIELPNGQWGAHWDMFANSDWFDIMFKSQIPSQQHNVNFSGGTKNTGYYVGLGYNESKGIIKGADDQKNRYTALLKVNTDATDWLSLRLSMNYLKTDEVAVN